MYLYIEKKFFQWQMHKEYVFVDHFLDTHTHNVQTYNIDLNFHYFCTKPRVLQTAI